MIEKINTSSSFEDKCGAVWEHYISRKLKNNFEPFWTHYPYTLVRKFLDKSSLNQEENFVLQETVKSHQQIDGTEVPIKNGFPNEGTRVMHDCWKAGSFTWIFMGRSFAEATQYNDFVVVSRTLPIEIYEMIDTNAPQTLYGAYLIDKPSIVGPAVDTESLFEAIDNSSYSLHNNFAGKNE